MNTQAIIRKSIPVIVKAHSGDGQYVDGIYQPAEKITYECNMAVAPLTPDELKYFEEERYEEDLSVEDRKFYDAVMDIEISDKENDILEKSGIEYEVVKVMDRREQGFKIYYGKVQK